MIETRTKNQKQASYIVNSNGVHNFSLSKIQTAKSMQNLIVGFDNNGIDLGQKIARKRSNELQTSISLTCSKSKQRLPSNHIFIKFNQNMMKSCNVLSHSQSSHSLLKTQQVDSTCRTTNKQLSFVSKQIQDNFRKRPKFIRCRNDKRKLKISNFVSDKNNGNDNYQEVLTENIWLKKKVLQNQKKIELLESKVESLSFSKNIKRLKQLQQKVKQLQVAMEMKNKQVKEANQKLEDLKEQNNELIRKFQDLPEEQSIFKNSFSSLDFDESGIKGGLLQTTQYVESLTDLEDQLQKRKGQIFNLNQLVQQLRMKNHFQEVRHEQSMKRLKNECGNKQMVFQHKYRNLMQMYRNLKSDKVQSSSQMIQRSTNPHLLHVQKEDLFNLSLSKSQIYFS